MAIRTQYSISARVGDIAVRDFRHHRRMVSGQWLVINGMTRPSNFSDKGKLIVTAARNLGGGVDIVRRGPILAQVFTIIDKIK